MAQRSGIPTLFMHGHVDRADVEYVEGCLEAAQLPPDHAMVWIDTTDEGHVHVTIEYGLGAQRLCVEATGASVVPTADECVEQLLWKTWSGSPDASTA
jgi:hypothetical protein